ncbi:MAG: fluoride efflux transporter CrcB [bacterium]|jgi:CrcB protein|nr:fluoride efflux transporter CrcB [Rhodocyclaceae bacterium]MCE2979290.1 fluoride efflux transporter CrcB [Betaproteobacteria bacterium]
MSASGLLAVGIGAALGAWLRWAFALLWNPLFQPVPLGTLAANLVGGLLIGATWELLGRNAGWPPEVRLFLVTGFLGGLTTFSTFSAETVGLLERGDFAWAGALVALHVCGSLAATVAGIAIVRRIAHAGGVAV